MIARSCLLCDPSAADAELHRTEVWSDSRWRLTMALKSEVPGFAYLEPRRHIPHLEDLEGEEAAALGPVLAATSRALRSATDGELVYVYVFGGGIEHLHLHLAPHRTGDALSDQIIRGDFVERRLPGGATEFVSTEFPLLPEDEILGLARKVRSELVDGASHLP
jgi:diadenosine tetraphosphate (Ap4A) HIT family hydrolase